jgi:hypothetical protein
MSDESEFDDVEAKGVPRLVAPPSLWWLAWSIVWSIFWGSIRLLFRCLTSRECSQALALFGALVAVVSSAFWYVSAKGAMEPHPTALLLRITTLYNFWAGGLAAASSLCVALSIMLKRD